MVSELQEEIQSPTPEEGPLSTELSQTDAQDTQGTEATVSESTGTDSEDSGYSLEESESYKEAMAARSAPKEAAPEPTELPGTPLSQVEEQAKRGRAAAYQTVISEDRDTFFDWIEKQTSLSREEANTLWNWHQRSLNTLHQGYEDWSAHVTNQQYKAALPKEVADKFFSRVYADQVEGMKGVLAHGEMLANQKWQARLDSGELFTKAEYEQHGREQLQKGRGLGERNQGTASSNQQFQGGTSEAASSASDDAKLLDPATPQAVIDAILAKRGI